MSLLPVRTDGLTLQYAGGRSVLQQISFEIESGETVAVAGENGCGKTTLLRILATLLWPTGGEVFLFGKEIKNEAKAIRRFIGWAPAQDQNFFPRLTGFENLLYFGGLKNVSAATVKHQLASWPEVAPLREALRTPYAACSTGMRQILNVARALLGAPPLLLLDEPFRGLSPKVTAALLEILFAQSATLVVTCHASAQAPWADRVLLLEEQKLGELQIPANSRPPELAL